mmetsp:Transcript_3297/g.6832  ORF Transcript_3297/g.6832 Transcript_3297/m.6832 type:complete len:90 (+) Transcript_3297:1017-1286(+)
MWYSLVFTLGIAVGYILGSGELNVNFKLDLRVIIGCLIVAGAYVYCVVRPLLWLIQDQSNVHSGSKVLGISDPRSQSKGFLRKTSSLYT